MLSRLLSHLGLLGRDRLKFVSGPTQVSVRARVASPNAVESPMTGMRAALIRIEAGERLIIHERHRDIDGGHYERQRREVFRPIDRMTLGEGLLLETPDGLVEVPAEGLRLVSPGEHEGSMLSLDRPLPPELAHVLEELGDSAGAYREHYLSHGDPVLLRAVVGPREPDPEDAPGQPIPWVARPDRGPVVIEDRSTAGGGALGDATPRFVQDRSWVLFAIFLGVVVAVMAWSEYSNDEHERLHPPPTTHYLRDTEGRAFDATCRRAGCALEQTGGPRTDDREPRMSAISLFHPGRVVGVCARDPSEAAPDWAYCRPLACSADTACPRLPGGERPACESGLCQRQGRSINAFDVTLLCNAGAGVGRAPDREGVAPLAEGVVPPGCRQP